MRFSFMQSINLFFRFSKIRCFIPESKIRPSLYLEINKITRYKMIGFTKLIEKINFVS